MKIIKGVHVDDDFELPQGYTIRIKHTGYAELVRSTTKKFYKILHRYIMNAKPGQQIDHIDRNKLNNQRSNLRFCNYTQNQANTPKKPDLTSVYKGVHWDKQKKRWKTQIKFNQKVIYLGRFQSEIEAAKAYDVKAKDLFGEFAKTNF